MIRRNSSRRESQTRHPVPAVPSLFQSETQERKLLFSMKRGIVTLAWMARLWFQVAHAAAMCTTLFFSGTGTSRYLILALGCKYKARRTFSHAPYTFYGAAKAFQVPQRACARSSGLIKLSPGARWLVLGRDGPRQTPQNKRMFAFLGKIHSWY